MIQHSPGLGGPTLHAAIAAVALSAISLLPAQEIEFHFSPRDGGLEEHQIKVTRVTQLEGEEDQLVELEKTVRVEKRKTAGGFAITERLIAAKASHDGREAENPILDALREIDIVKETGDDGKILDVRGYEKIAGVLKSKLPEEAAAELGAAIDEEAMAGQEKSEWEATVGRFAGKHARVGDVWNGNESFALPGEDLINVLAGVRFARIVPCRPRQCVLLELTFGSEGPAPGNQVRNVFENAAHKKGQWVGQTGSAVTSVEGRGERVIDPATLDLISEKIERSIRMLVDVPGEGKLPMVIRETAETTVTQRN